MIGFLTTIASGIGECFHSVTRPSWVEWDNYDVKLHGQQIRFNLPMVCVPVDTIECFGTSDIPINWLIKTPDITSHSVQESLDSIDDGINSDVVFTIRRSFWVRQNWWDTSFASYNRMLVIQSPEGENALLSFWDLTNTDKPELTLLSEDSYLK